MTREDAVLECMTRWGTEPGFLGPYAEQTEAGFVIGFVRTHVLSPRGGAPAIRGRGPSWDAALKDADDFEKMVEDLGMGSPKEAPDAGR